MRKFLKTQKWEPKKRKKQIKELGKHRVNVSEAI